MRRWTLPVLGIVLIVVGLCGVAATLLLVHPSPSRTRDTGSPSDRREDRSGDSRQAGSVDAMFIEQMIPHHDDAIAMSEVALDNAEHPEIRDLAEKIIATQSDENERMREWYREWFGGDVPDDGSSDMMDWMMGGEVDLDEFARAEPFDQAFIEQMVPHHRMAIMMARMLRSQTEEPEMRQLADDIIESQTEEIEQMQAWYREWYGG